VKKTKNLSRNIAIIGVFAVLAALAGVGSWLTTVPVPVKVTERAEAELPSGVEVVHGATPHVEVDYLTTAAITEDDLRLSYPSTPAPLAEASRGWAEDQARAFEAEGEDQLEVRFEPVLVAGSFLGINLTAEVTRGEDHTVREQNFFTDLESTRAWAPQQLVTDDGVIRLGRLVREAAKAGALGDIELPTPQTAQAWAEQGLAGAAFTADGLLVPVGQSGRSLLVHEPEELLTGAGKRIAAAAAANEEFTGLPEPNPNTPPAGTPIEFPGEDSVDCNENKCIALTFDDGPAAGTIRLLDILAREDARATFFLVGSQVAGREQTVQRMVAEGHIVGNHTWQHLQLPEKSRKEVGAQIDRTADAIVAAGAPHPTLLRPPYGALSDEVSEEIAGRGYATVLWDADTLDWETRNTKKTVKNALTGARPGGIILMHDIHPETVQAVPQIIKELREDGYTLVTVPELFGGEMTVGGVYRSHR